MTSSVTAVASFERDLSDPDDDGLTTHDELVLHGTDPAEADSDDDGLPDGDEILLTHTNPHADDAALLATLGNAFSAATSGRLALTPADGREIGGSMQVSVGFLQSTNGVSWSAVALDQAALDTLLPGSRLRLRFPMQPGAPGVWRVFSHAPDGEH